MRRRSEQQECRDTRRKLPMALMADVALSMELLSTQSPLPDRLWAAWMAEKCGVDTYEVFHDGNGEVVGFGTTLLFERTFENGVYVGLRRTGEALNYLQPSQITERLFRRIGTPAQRITLEDLGHAVLLLENDASRESALRACNALDRNHDGPGVPTAAERSRVIAGLAGKPGAAGMPQPAAPEPQQTILTLSPPMTEPAEVFVAELERLKEGRGRNVPVSPVGTFFGEEVTQ